MIRNASAVQVDPAYGEILLLLIRITWSLTALLECSSVIYLTGLAAFLGSQVGILLSS